MTVQTMNRKQVLPFAAHLAEACAIDAVDVERLRQLAEQLHTEAVMPVVGAGCSYDCGMLIASQIAASLRIAYFANPDYAPYVADPGPDLGALTEAIATRCGQRAAVEAVGLHDSGRWPSADEVEPHFCVYRVLARLSREREASNSLSNAMSFNYDCGWEAALKAEGVMFDPMTVAGRIWNDHATIIADPATNNSTIPRGRFVLVKAHGCAERYRREIVRDPASGAENDIVIRADQLVDWGKRGWSRDVLRNSARSHILLLIGFSGQDPVIAATLQEILVEVHKSPQNPGVPRVIVIDRVPNTARLEKLVAAGLGGKDAKADAITAICIGGSATATAAALVLLVETLALNLKAMLKKHGLRLPDDMDARLAALIVSAPTMLRWSYLLRTPADDDFTQRINLQQAERGYVPLMVNASTTVRALRTRAELRKALGRTESESTHEALADHAFVVAGGCAFLPVGLGHDELMSACRPGGKIDQTKHTLGHPAHLDCILVSDGPDGRRGTHIGTGAEVEVP